MNGCKDRDGDVEKGAIRGGEGGSAGQQVVWRHARAFLEVGAHTECSVAPRGDHDDPWIQGTSGRNGCVNGSHERHGQCIESVGPVECELHDTVRVGGIQHEGRRRILHA